MRLKHVQALAFRQRSRPQGKPSAEYLAHLARGARVWPVVQVTQDEDRPELVATPSTLALARESRGLTQGDLAKMISETGSLVTQGYISRAESGRLAVTGDRLKCYAAALAYAPWVLCRQIDEWGPGIGLIHHRKRAAMGATGLRRIHAQLAFDRLRVQLLLERTGEISAHQFGPCRLDDLNTPADAAREMRKRWNLPPGPIENLVAVVEAAGAVVIVRDLGSADLDAVSQPAGVDPPLFLLSRRAPGDRFRFSLGHEIGHVVLHSAPSSAAILERQANEFSSELLMPAKDIRDELPRHVDLARLLELKARWRMSLAALARRALTLDTLSEWQYRSLLVEMSALGYRTREPEPIPMEHPSTITERLRWLIDNGASQASLRETLGIDQGEIDDLYGKTSTRHHSATAEAR
jgi:Zn-dependent peptidase ImmA (M78 family)/transcriptional regulator with XRE-family HTH domain